MIAAIQRTRTNIHIGYGHMVELPFVHLFVVTVSRVLYRSLFLNRKKNVYFDEKEYHNKTLYVFSIDLFCLSSLNI